MTQEYTPVAWQDETTSQQGTLINAERLNQMQTAHHFADGLEEVDAVPTADPGVSYHKIVYCTADSTIYRWDGTEWTADIDDETKRLLQQEIARATAAESELAQDLADEATARETADTAMQADISALGDAIEAEETARGQADTALGTRITNETSARETADTALGNRITAEATARADADTALGGRIDTEQARAEAAEQANAQAIANTYTKAEIDTALGAKADVATTYTKTETDALLAGKADVATTYTKTEIDTLLGAKANDNVVVHLAGAETIGGVKTFTSLVGIAINGEYHMSLLDARMDITDTDSTAQYWNTVQFTDKNNSKIAQISAYQRGEDTRLRLYAFKNSGSYNLLDIISDGTNFYMTAPTRGYNAGSAYSNDVATIGTLDAYSPMVRTSGNQDIGGIKNYTGTLKASGPLDFGYVQTVGDVDGKWIKVARWNTPNLSNQCVLLAVGSGKPAISRRYGLIMVGGSFPETPVCIGIGATDLSGLIAVATDSDGYGYLLFKRGGNYGFVANKLLDTNWGGLIAHFEPLATHEIYDDLSTFTASMVIT